MPEVEPTTRADTQDLERHLAVWLGNLPKAALSLAVAGRLLGLRQCNTAARQWLIFATAALRLADEQCGHRCRAIDWALGLAPRMGWEGIAEVPCGARLALPLVLLRLSFRFARQVGNAVASAFLGRWLYRMYLRKHLPIPVWRELCTRTPWRVHPGWYVSPTEGFETATIEVHQNAEHLNMEGMRVRPHGFMARSCTGRALELNCCRVAQVVATRTIDGTLMEGPHIDTIAEDNTEFPFWPHAALADTSKASHRCSVHPDGNGLAWSDWPQVHRTDEACGRQSWSFTTGLFRVKNQGDVSRYDLMGKTDWEVEWSR